MSRKMSWSSKNSLCLKGNKIIFEKSYNLQLLQSCPETCLVIGYNIFCILNNRMPLLTSTTVTRSEPSFALRGKMYK